MREAQERLRQHHAAHESAGAALDVALDARDLSGEEHARARSKLHARIERARRVDERVAVDAAEPQDLRLLEPRDRSQDARLLRPRHARLEADEVVRRGRRVFLAQLDDGERARARARVDQADGLHRAESERHRPARGHDVDGETALEVLHFLEAPRLDLGSADHVGHEGEVLRLVHRAVHVRLVRAVFGALSVAGLLEHAVPIDRIGGDDGGDRVVVREVVAADDAREVGGERVAREGARREHHGGLGRRIGDGFDDARFEPDPGVDPEARRDERGEGVAIDGQRAAGRHARRVGAAQDERAGPAQLFLEQTDGVGERRPAKRVRADELAEGVGGLRGSARVRLLLDEGHVDPPLGELPGQPRNRPSPRR